LIFIYAYCANKFALMGANKFALTGANKFALTGANKFANTFSGAKNYLEAGFS
jgi:hypothetical protein